MVREGSYAAAAKPGEALKVSGKDAVITSVRQYPGGIGAGTLKAVLATGPKVTDREAARAQTTVKAGAALAVTALPRAGFIEKLGAALALTARP